MAVEPAPDNAAIARENIARSPYADRISLLTVAVAATDGEMPFYLDEGNPQMHALLPTSDNQAYFKAKGTVMVPVWSFERLMAERGCAEIDLGKLDWEGAEFPILLETRAEVLQRVKRWVIEYHAAPQPLEESLRSLGLLGGVGERPCDDGYFVCLSPPTISPPILKPPTQRQNPKAKHAIS